MALHGRNEPCPCGSGRKYKRCCLDREQELIRRAGALEEAKTMALLFPRLRPLGEEFEAWAGSAATDELSAKLILEGVERLTVADCERIALVLTRDLAEAWASLAADVGNDRAAFEALLAGGVGAALRERRDLEPDLLAIVEEHEEVRRDPAEALAVVLNPCDLWGIDEATVAGESGDDFAVLAKRFWSDDHDRRLAVLVDRVRTRLPAQGYPLASAALERACRACARSRRSRLRLATLLLEDTLPWARLVHAYAALAA